MFKKVESMKIMVISFWVLTFFLFSVKTANAGFLFNRSNCNQTAHSKKVKYLEEDNYKKKDAINYELIDGRIDDYSFIIHLITLDLNQNYLIPDIVLASDKFGKIRKLSTICKKYGAIAGINGAFFNVKSRCPVGYLIMDGIPLKAPLERKERTTFGIMKNGQILVGKPKFRRRIRPEHEYFSIIDDINRECSNFEIIMFNNKYGEKTKIPEGGKGFSISNKGIITNIYEAGSVKIPKNGKLVVVGRLYVKSFEKTKIGDKVLLTQTLMYPWENIKSGFGSVISLVSDGKISYDKEREDVSSGLLGRAARTAAALTKDDKLLLFATDAKSKKFKGITLMELAKLMKALGAVDAVSLDGGSSTTMYYKGKIVNMLHKGHERPVANALIIVPSRR